MHYFVLHTAITKFSRILSIIALSHGLRCQELAQTTRLIMRSINTSLKCYGIAFIDLISHRMRFTGIVDLLRPRRLILRHAATQRNIN